MIKKSGFIIEDLKLKDLKKFTNFLRNYYENKILINKKYYKSVLLNKKMLNFLFWNKKKNFYNIKIIKSNNSIVFFHAYIPQSHFDDKLSNNEIFLGLVIAEKKLKIPLLPLTLSAISNKAKFLGTINPTLLPILKIKKFQVQEMNHLFIKNSEKDKIKDSKMSKYKFLNQKKFKLLNTQSLYKGLTPQKSDNFIINRYLKHPIYKYSLVANFDLKMSLKSILVFRKIRNKKINLIRIVDYIGKEKDLIYCNSALVDLIKNVDFIDFYSFGISSNIYQKTGFKNIKDYKNIIIPNYFEPYVNKNIELLCGIKTNSKENIMLFKGDGDQDHPRKK